MFIFLVDISALYGQDYRITYQSMEWRPNNYQIAFTAIKVKKDWSDYSPEKWHLYLYDLKSKKLFILENSCIYFSFSPSGKQIVYDKDGESGKAIFILDLETCESELLVSNPGKDAGPDWSSDGNGIIFYSDRDGNEELYYLERSSHKITQLTQRESCKSYNPKWSPDYNLIAYYLEKGDAKDQIYLTDSMGSFQKNLTNDDHHNIYPSWTPNGKILYIRDEGEVMIINPDGSDKKRLWDGPAGLVRMDSSGKKLLLTKNDGNIYIVNLMEDTIELIIDKEIFD
jgi:Tol biopolymer transport system component